MRWLAVTLLAGLLLVPSPAQAVDTRPCVSKVEFNWLNESRTKREIETRWEVEGLGNRVVFPIIGPVVLYPRCGQVNDYPQAFYGVAYELRNGQYWATGTVWS